MITTKRIVVLLATLIPSVTIADSVYRIRDVGDLPGGDDLSWPEGLNNEGEVVGQSDSGAYLAGFLWRSDGSLQDLRPMSAQGINDSTEVVGAASGHAALWDEINGIQDLGVLPGDSDYSQANDINNAGQVVGVGDISDFYDHAFVWDSANGMRDLGTLVGDDGHSYASAINNLGQVVGQSSAESGGSHAFLWGSVNGMQDLGKLPGAVNDTSFAYDINDVGQVIGWSEVSDFGQHAFVWDSVNGMQDLGVLSDSENTSYAFSINNSGQIVGTSLTPTDYRAVLWNSGQIIDLNDVIDPTDPLAPYVTLTQARAINDAGQIAVTGEDSRSGATHAYLLTPVVLLDLASLSDVNGNGAADVAVLVGGQTAESKVYVKDGASGDAISETTILNGSWQAVDLAVTPGGANALIGVLAHRDDGLIRVALHRARDGALVRRIAYFAPAWLPLALVYVPNPDGPGSSGFGVLAENSDDGRVSVQLRRRSDGGLINTTTFFQDGWTAIDLETMNDASGNNHPEIIVLGQSYAGQVVASVRDASTRGAVNRVVYFGTTTIPSGITVIGNIGAGIAPELPVLGLRSDGKHLVQSRDALTDESVSNVFFFNSSWNTIDLTGVADVNGNTSADLAVLAQDSTTHAIRAQVRDSLTGDLIRTVSFFGSSWNPRALSVFDDINGNGAQELGILAAHNDGTVRVQIRDASSGSTISTINIP
jgi:probable HAF family extracellular repeat protein